MRSDLLNLLRAGGVRVRGAAEPAQDPRETLCDKLKAKLDLDLDPKKITRMRSDGIEYNGDVDWRRKKLTKIPVKFLVVRGTFNCSHNSLTTLENSPEYVGKDFNCSDNHLTTLEHAPGHVGASCYCHNNRLHTLRGSLEYVGEKFNCSNNKLTSLGYAPARVDGDFVCESNLLTDIDFHQPVRIGGNLVCHYNNLPDDTKKPVGVKGYLHFQAKGPPGDFDDMDVLDDMGWLDDIMHRDVRGAAEPAQDPLTETVLRKLAEKLENARASVISTIHVSPRTLEVELYTRFGPQNEDEAVLISFAISNAKIDVGVGTISLTKPYPGDLDQKQQLQFLGKLVLDTVDAVQEYFGKGYTEACTLLEKQYFEAKSKLAHLYKIKADGKLPSYEVIFTEPW